MAAIVSPSGAPGLADFDELHGLEKDASGGEVLTYGSCVSLSTKQDQAVDKDLYLHTDISHATKAYARAFRTDAEGDSHELRSGSIGNIHTIAFQIVPPHDFRARKALRQELLNRKTWEEKQIDRETAWQKVVTKKSSDPMKDMQAIEKIKKQLGVIDGKKLETEDAIRRKTVEVETEDKMFTEKMMAQHGKPLLYGQIVQLKQVYTNKYLSISDKTVARLAYNHMGVFLYEFGGNSANFKVMPRFKIRGEGDPVRGGDQCVLLSEKASGQYLTCTDAGKVFGKGKLITHEHVFQMGDHEASANAAQRGWTMKELFRVPQPTKGKQKAKVFIQAGDVVRLQHREMGLMLSAAGGGYADMKNPHPTDLASIWQICHHGPYSEIYGQSAGRAGSTIFNKSNRLDGGKIKHVTAEDKKLKNPISFRNLRTGQYLSSQTGDFDYTGEKSSLGRRQTSISSLAHGGDTLYADVSNLADADQFSGFGGAGGDDFDGFGAESSSLLHLSSDSKGGGFGSMERTAFGFVPVDSAKTDFVENSGYYRIKDKVSLGSEGAFVHFPENGQDVEVSPGVHATPPELLNGSDSFQDVFQITKIDDQLLKDIYFVQGLTPILQELVLHIASSDEDLSEDGSRAPPTSSRRSSLAPSTKPDLLELLKSTAADNKGLSNIMQVGITLCKELADFLNPLDSDGQVDVKVAGHRRTLLQTFNVLKFLVQLLHTPLVGHTGPELEAAAAQLQQGEFEGVSLLSLLWEETLNVLSIVSSDHQNTVEGKAGGVKEYLVNFFRTFTVHLIYFGSKRAAHMLVALAKGSRDVCDQIVKDRGEGDVAGDFRFLLSFLSLPPQRTGNMSATAISFEFFNVLTAFCTQGGQAVIEVQDMIAKTLTGKAPLVGRNLGRLAFEKVLLLSFSQEQLGERAIMMIEKPIDKQGKALDTKKRLHLHKDSDWKQCQSAEGKIFYQSKTDPTKILLEDPDPEEFEWSTEGEAQALKISAEFIAKLLMVLYVKPQTGVVHIGFKQMEEKELPNICESINPERADTTFNKTVNGIAYVYYEPTLRDEQLYFLLEAQMNMMAEVSQGDYKESKMLVKNHYSKEVLSRVFTDPTISYGLRTASIRLFFNLYTNVGGIVPDGHRPQFIYRWDGEDRVNIGNDEFIPYADEVHTWLVGAGASSSGLKRQGSVRRASDIKQGPSFKSDLEGFMAEMAHIVANKQPWNGMNSSKRVPFHEKQGVFVVTTLEVARFLTLVRYYNRPKNERKGHELLAILQSCVLKFAFEAVNYKTSMAEDLTRNVLIDRVLTLTLELVELLTFVKIERDAVNFFMLDYRYIYSQSFELDQILLDDVHNNEALAALTPQQVTKAKAQTDWGSESRHPCVHLTHPVKMNDVVQSGLPGVRAEHLTVQTYLKWVFSRGLDSEVLKSVTEVLLDLAKSAPASVSLKATDLIVNLQSSQQSFFSTCSKIFIVVKDETAVRWNDIRMIGQRLFQLIHNSIMDEHRALQVKKHISKLQELLLSVDEKGRKSVERDFQELCFKEGIAHLLLSILKHDLDDDQLDNEGSNAEATISQDMLICCLGLLANMSDGYEPVQEIMLHEMVSLLNYKNCLGPLVAANLVNAMAPAMKNIKLQAKVREVHLVALIKRMLVLYDKGFFVAEFLDLLFTIAWAHDGVVDLSVVFTNQATIITQLMKNGTIGKDMLEDVDRISSWSGFEDEDSARVFDDAKIGDLTICLKGKGWNEKLPGIVLGDKEGDDPKLWKHELCIITKSVYDEATGIATLDLKEPLTHFHADGTSITKPSKEAMLVSNIALTTEILTQGAARVGITRKGLSPGVNVIIGSGTSKELNTIKAFHVSKFGIDEHGADILNFELEFDLPVQNEHPSKSTIIPVGTPSIKKGTLDSIRLDKQYVISLVELLAICGAGKNRYIEAICKQIIPIEMETTSGVTDREGGLINVITKKILAKKFKNGLLEEHIELPRFKAYMKYLYHIYLSENCLVQIELRYPLITNPDTWEILEQCTGEVVAFSNDVGNDGNAENGPVDEIVFNNRLSLLFDVCGPFLSAVFKAHYTVDNLEIARDLSLKLQREAGGGKDDASTGEIILDKEQCENEFYKIAPRLIEGLTRTLVQGRHQRWWQPTKHGDLLGKLLYSLLEDAVGNQSIHIDDIIDAELMKEQSMQTGSAQINRSLMSFKDPAVAGPKLSAMLEANPSFNSFIILTQRKSGAEEGNWCLHPGDDGLVTHGMHVNMQLMTFMQRMQELDSVENRDHGCHLVDPATQRIKFEDCRYLEDLHDGGLPSTTQFQKVTELFSENNAKATPVILKHLRHIRDRLHQKPVLGDDERQKLYTEVANMFNLLAAILHDVTCELHGSKKPLSKEKQDALEERQNMLQMIMVDGEGNHSVLVECLEYLQEPNHQVMKSAFRVFVACLQDAPDSVLSDAHRILETTTGGNALQKLRDELESGLMSVRDNLIRVDEMVEAKSQEEANRLMEEAKSEQNDQARSHRQKLQQMNMTLIKEYMDKIKNGISGERKEAPQEETGAQASIMKKDTSKSDDKPFTFDIVKYNWCVDMVQGIGSIVEGGHSGIRQAFREQKENSVNFVSVLCNSVKVLPSEVQDPEHQKLWLKLVGGLAYALSELCEGQVKNQKASFESDIFKHVNHFIRLSHRQNYLEVAQMQSQILALVGAMLESNVHRDTKFANEMANALDLVGIRMAMNSLYFLNFFCAHFGSASTDFPKLPDAVLHGNAFRCYWVLRRIQDLTGMDIEHLSRPAYWEEDDGNDTDTDTKVVAHAASEDAQEDADDDEEASEQSVLLRSIKKGDDELFVFMKKQMGDAKRAGGDGEYQQFHTFWQELLVDFSHNLTSSQNRDRMSYYLAKTSSIEFVKEEALEKLYFHYEDSLKMSQIYRSRVLADLDWSSAQNKVRDFIEKFNEMKGAMQVQEKLKSKFYARYISDGTSFRWQVAAMILTYALNILLMVGFSLDNTAAAGTTARFLLPKWHATANLVLGVMHVIVSFGVVVQYFVNQSTGEGALKLLTGDPSSSLYFVSFLGFSIAGLFTHGYCYVFHLLYIVQNNKDLKSAVNAVTFNGKSLLWVAFLTVTIIYMFTFFSFVFFREDFDNNEGMYCNTLTNCFATLIANSLEGGGIRDQLGPGQQGDNQTAFNDEQVGRIFLDILFWILIVTIMMNLVLGIIVDTFSQLREEQAHQDDEMTNKCFICSLPAYRFEKVGGFKKHIQQDHNMWMYTDRVLRPMSVSSRVALYYPMHVLTCAILMTLIHSPDVYYTIYLEKLSRAGRTDLQDFLHDMWIKNRNHSPFPIMRALSMEMKDRDNGDMVQNIMNMLREVQQTGKATQQNLGFMSSQLRDKMDEIRGETPAPTAGAPTAARRMSTVTSLADVNNMGMSM